MAPTCERELEEATWEAPPADSIGTSKLDAVLVEEEPPGLEDPMEAPEAEGTVDAPDLEDPVEADVEGALPEGDDEVGGPLEDVGLEEEGAIVGAEREVDELDDVSEALEPGPTLSDGV